MSERKKTHLIYADLSGFVWMQEFSNHEDHPQNAAFFSEVPSNDDKRWKAGRPNISNVRFLTLSPFYPSQRLDVSVEIDLQPKILGENGNHKAFDGCVKYMELPDLDFRPIPKHIPRGVYEFGLFYSGKEMPHKTVEIEEDNKQNAKAKATKMLNPGVIEFVKYMSVRSNEKYDEHYGEESVSKKLNILMESLGVAKKASENSNKKGFK